MFTTQNGCMPERSGGAKGLLAICPFLLQNAKEGFSPISLRGDIVALYTKKLIMTTFQEMLAEMPFDRITVSALVKRAGGSPNTFYYHYQDIYALLDDWFQKQVDALVPVEEPIEWKPVTKNILRECRAHSKTIYHVFDSLSRDRLGTLFENFLHSAVQDAE